MFYLRLYLLLKHRPISLILQRMSHRRSTHSFVSLLDRSMRELRPLHSFSFIYSLKKIDPSVKFRQSDKQIVAQIRPYHNLDSLEKARLRQIRVWKLMEKLDWLNLDIGVCIFYIHVSKRDGSPKHVCNWL